LGISAGVFQKMLDVAAKRELFGPGAMLGRQRVNRAGEIARIQAKLSARGIELERSEIVDEGRYADRLFRLLGIGDLQVVDLSDYEGADVILDLSQPLPVEHERSFGFIYDGGTTEHIFDTVSAFRNIDRMLKPGGTFASCVPMNGWPGHGFYQMQPALVYSFWRDALGYEVDSCTAVAAGEPVESEGFRLRSGHRNNWRLPEAMAGQKVNLCYVVTKPAEGRAATLDTEVHQGFYKDVWRTRGALAAVPGERRAEAEQNS
jgi:SAM-dependent methyltransferase